MNHYYLALMAGFIVPALFLSDKTPTAPKSVPAIIKDSLQGGSNAVFKLSPRGREVHYKEAGFIKVGGTRSWRNFNPGNLEYKAFSVKHGAIGTDGRFAIFPDYQTGKSAQIALLKQRYGNYSIAGMINRYAPPFENDTGAYVRSIVPSGATAQSRINDLSEPQFNEMINKMGRHEDWRAGKIIKLRD